MKHHIDKLTEISNNLSKINVSNSSLEILNGLISFYEEVLIGLKNKKGMDTNHLHRDIDNLKLYYENELKHNDTEITLKNYKEGLQRYIEDLIICLNKKL